MGGDRVGFSTGHHDWGQQRVATWRVCVSVPKGHGISHRMQDFHHYTFLTLKLLR